VSLWSVVYWERLLTSLLTRQQRHASMVCMLTSVIIIVIGIYYYIMSIRHLLVPDSHTYQHMYSMYGCLLALSLIKLLQDMYIPSPALCTCCYVRPAADHLKGLQPTCPTPVLPFLPCCLVARCP
jgi:hypothetical protein